MAFDADFPVQFTPLKTRKSLIRVLISECFFSKVRFFNAGDFFTLEKYSCNNLGSTSFLGKISRFLTYVYGLLKTSVGLRN